MALVLFIISGLLIVGTLLPLIDSEHWVVRGQAYFRAVYLVLNAILLVLLLLFFREQQLTWIFSALLIFSIFLCLKSILTFTRFGEIQVHSSTSSDDESTLDIVVYNVYQFNNHYQGFLDLAERIKPDIIFLIETNSAWAEGLKSLKEDYPYHFSDIRENTYGLMLFSKIELLEGGINYLVKPDIPSAEILISKNNEKVRILGLHPRPPVPGESYSSKSKDRELVQAAIYFNEQVEDDHQILIGDLNDVAWSRASLGFKKMTGMQDPRAGRGFYSTFPTWFPIKIPLDHVFCSEKLQIKDFKVLENIGSDHYPVHVTFHIPDIK